MPELTWIGKDKVVNHHHDVPFRILEKQYSYGAENSGNRIIHGDNLEALKSLLPEYENRVKCIYIDPPYNTGNEGWVYNDNVNDPKLKRWLKQVVGKEGEDLSRHDKWLCMMYPRLKLLRRLLSHDGAIFVSIDDVEQANLRSIMDEVFGRDGFIANVIWQKKQSPQNDATNFSDMHDFVVVYAKKKKQSKFDLSGWQRNLIPRDESQNKRYKNPDDDTRGNWASGDCTSNKNSSERPNLYYSIKNPITGNEVFPPKQTVWRYEKSTFSRLIDENRIYWGKRGENFPRLKIFLEQVAGGVVPSTWWVRELAGDNQEARRELRSIFNHEESDFTTPKPSRLIERILQVGTAKDSIILDSFAGSGTTAHAVLKLNAADGGNRKFILIEQEDYSETITAERVRRVIDGYGSGDKAVAGLGGGFDYYEIGPALFLAENVLNEDIGIAEIRKYIAFTEGIEPADATDYFLGSQDGMAYYFYYERDESTTLDLEFLSGIATRPKRMLIYADRCLLSKPQLADFGITFKKIPRDITRF